MPKRPYLYLGIDPGASGGLAVLEGDGRVILASPMPDTAKDTWERMTEVIGPSHARTFAAIERVGGYIQGNPAPGSAMFRFGFSTGILYGFLIAAMIPYEEVTPQRWQRMMSIAPRFKDEARASFKNRLKNKAQQLFPYQKVTLATADALLIAEYSRRKRRGVL